jgi:hypothetical protein
MEEGCENMKRLFPRNPLTTPECDKLRALVGDVTRRLPYPASMELHAQFWSDLQVYGLHEAVAYLRNALDDNDCAYMKLTRENFNTFGRYCEKLYAKYEKKVQQ